MAVAVMDFSKRKRFGDVERLRKVGRHDSSLRVAKERLEKRVVKDRLEITKHGENSKKRFRDEEETLVKCGRPEKNKDEDSKRRRKLREREREAARMRLLEMEKRADVESNCKSYRELETLSGCSLVSFVFLAAQEESRVVSAAFQGSHFWNPLEKLGLRLKDDDRYEDVDDVIREGDRSKASRRVDMIEKEESRKGSLDDEKAVRVAMLRRRYANIIVKAQRKTLFC